MQEITLTSIVLTICLSVCVFLATLCFRKVTNNQLYDSLDRSSPLDAMRGILALSVMTHHFYITYVWKTQGLWQKPANHYLDNLGAVSVSLFFLTTGFLFLNKIRKPNIDWSELYKSRFKRIVPLFTFVASIVIAITFVTIERSINDAESLKFIAQWLLFVGGDIDSFDSRKIIAGVHWSLVYEWGFYLALPFIFAVLHKTLPNKILLALLLIPIIYIFHITHTKLYLLFALSYLSIFFKDKIKELIDNYSKVLSVTILLLLVFTLIFTRGYSVIQQILLSIIFAFIANGLDLGILKNKGLKVLGDISYSIYLVHGIVLYTLFSIFNVFDFSNSIFEFITYFPIVFVITVLSSLLTHKYIEKRFIKPIPSINKENLVQM